MTNSLKPPAGISDEAHIKLQAAAFERLVMHLREHTETQNIDLMNLAGFCRNCLSKWYQEAAETQGHKTGKEEVRTMIYGMPYEEWKARYQK